MCKIYGRKTIFIKERIVGSLFGESDIMSAYIALAKSLGDLICSRNHFGEKYASVMGDIKIDTKPSGEVLESTNSIEFVGLTSVSFDSKIYEEYRGDIYRFMIFLSDSLKELFDLVEMVYEKDGAGYCTAIVDSMEYRKGRAECMVDKIQNDLLGDEHECLAASYNA